MPKIRKLCIHLLKLCRENRGLFFPVTIASLGQGHVPQVPQWHDVSARKKQTNLHKKVKKLTEVDLYKFLAQDCVTPLNYGHSLTVTYETKLQQQRLC